MFAGDKRYQTVALSLLAGLLLSAAVAHAQVKDRLIEQITIPVARLPVPVEIVTIKVRGRQVQVGQTFADDDDWIKGLELTFKNTSEKPIVYLSVDLRLPSPEGIPVAFPIFYGRSPATSEEAARLAQAHAVQPGETATVTLTERQYESMQAVLAERNWKLPLDKLTIKVNIVSFADDTSWHHGYQYRRDPNDPRMWKAVREAEAGVRTP